MSNKESVHLQYEVEALSLQGPALFSLGRCVATPGALAMMETLNLPAGTLLRLHQNGSWGQLDAHDCAMNQQALINGYRIFSAYTLANGERLFVITDAEDDNGLRLSTMVMLPSEY